MSHDGKFEPFKGKDGRWRWRQIGGNGEPMSVSQAYASRSNAVRGANTAKKNAKGAPVQVKKPAAKKPAAKKSPARKKK